MVKILRIFQLPAVIRVNGVLGLDVLPEEINNNYCNFWPSGLCGEHHAMLKF